MHFINPSLHSRRAFLKRSAQLAFTGSALPTAINLAAMADAAALTADDNKTLVCVFLYGGNDPWNTVVPYDQKNYDLYKSIRGGITNGIALDQTKLLALDAVPTAGVKDQSPTKYGLHPQLKGLATLFNTGKAAIQLNVGPLIVPMNRSQYDSTDRKSFPLPPKLFSHNDQQSIWQTSHPEGTTKGWGGSIGDLILQNSVNGSNSTFTCVSLADSAVFLAGENAVAYQTGTNGATKINCLSGDLFGSTDLKKTMNILINQYGVDGLEKAYQNMTARSIAAEGIINGSISSTEIAAKTNSGAFTPFAGIPDTNSLAAQLKMVARLIEAQSNLKIKRQVFFVSLGGFDMHDALKAGHDLLLPQVDDAITAFYKTTDALKVANKVTTFTASDFGRTLSSNGDGSDHGWGSHHFIVGGAVKGKQYYGKAPPVSNSGSGALNERDQWHVGQGRLLPSTSVDQYAATLATWFGVNKTEIDVILPNLKNFGSTSYPRDLGFLSPS